MQPREADLDPKWSQSGVLTKTLRGHFLPQSVSYLPCLWCENSPIIIS